MSPVLGLSSTSDDEIRFLTTSSDLFKPFLPREQMGAPRIELGTSRV
jgi:hypothetical protein